MEPPVHPEEVWSGCFPLEILHLLDPQSMWGNGRDNQDGLSNPSHGHNLSVGSFGMDLPSAVFGLPSLPALHHGGRSWVSFPKGLQIRFGLLETTWSIFLGLWV